MVRDPQEIAEARPPAPPRQRVRPLLQEPLRTAVEPFPALDAVEDLAVGAVVVVGGGAFPRRVPPHGYIGPCTALPPGKYLCWRYLARRTMGVPTAARPVKPVGERPV